MNELRKCVMGGEFEAALLKTSMIQNPFQAITAANKALHQRQNNRMITKNIHSEILFCLSPLKGISDSFRKFGVSDDDKSVFVAVVDDRQHKVLKQIVEKVQGKLHDMTDLESLCDVANIKKIYKVTAEEMQVGPLVDALVTRIAMKDTFAV
ncbi:CGI121 [Acanthosepion pharaonis]|uniref:CGI121 n=1 Tax=Acanthosepion pharaonis TaxID=158019 RepID=A0A812BRP7_ACAPH|nr:CGI121 [Sepia pharaonis]